MVKKFLKLNSKVILAPMHDTTNVCFRLMCKKYGAGLVSTELLSANAVARKNKAVLNQAFFSEKEKPIVSQIFSNNTENMVKSAKILEDLGFDIIDINLGCPSEKIMKQGSGGALLKRKDKVFEIVKKINESVKIPVTVKIRSGFDKSSINAVDISKACEEACASAIIIHARTVKQGYSGKADWNIIKEIKKSVKIPVIGNGDVVDGKSCRKMLDETCCDYVMVGRAAIGNPFIFKEINEYLKSGKIVKQTKKEKISDFFEYLDLCEEYDMINFKDIKQKAVEFTKGLSGSSNFRRKIQRVKDIDKIRDMVKGLLEVRG
ncbi:tRNA dihydrouridine synthase DusB [Candidatus Pacearchaeota archaeon]|nr:tRNA dihydrouridine synthase DusB [Candidatus Pacearchaeota archaeon]